MEGPIFVFNKGRFLHEVEHDMFTTRWIYDQVMGLACLLHHVHLYHLGWLVKGTKCCTSYFRCVYVFV